MCIKNKEAGRRERSALRRLIALMAALLLLASASCSEGEPRAGAAMPADLTRPLVASLNLQPLMLHVIKGKAAALMPALQPQQRFGQIEIPRIGLREWLVQGTGKEDLTLGAGHIEGTPLPGVNGNFGVAGDRVLYTAPFLRLNQLAAGDLILIHMPYAELRYRVESMTTVDPSQVSVLDPRGYDSVTLSTCDPTWQTSTRLIVSGRLEQADVAG